MSDTGQTTDQAVKDLGDLLGNARICMLTTMTEDGKHVSRPMAVQDAEFDGDLWFFTYDDSDKARQVAANPEVNVAFADAKHSTWTSVSGRASVVHDRAKAEQLYSPALKVWFPEGLETEGVALLKVETTSAEYWDAPSSTIKTAVGALRAAVTKNPDAFPAENRTIEL
ncbi:pyridoxamine 5'-phosphate oxidase family protein [Nocardioides sp. HDW12B]|uniref:pyridoxamine 5'-phosphate oxidase family protein n=1 Tax=Nocardioides sp. HDW12B TaxID=2714939 RepID=UPI00140D1662|nr:pyridoxamine 5'-phosphate oxidase family protein [Nocardioides sp. HDW12B]QIK67246.1 pyridoxamine 5'-phosphate oxidase family protein [Nocardioides sp. HDW12B]